jgi:hypothetical protein
MTFSKENAFPPQPRKLQKDKRQGCKKGFSNTIQTTISFITEPRHPLSESSPKEKELKLA